MITLEPTQDIAYLDQVMHEPEVIKHMIDDNCKDLSQLSFQRVLGMYHNLFIKVLVDGIPAGWFWGYAKPDTTDQTLEAHAALLPNCRGTLAVQAGRKVIDWVFHNTPCQNITTFEWSDEPTAIWYVLHLGFSPIGREPYPVTRQGHTVDKLLFILARQTWEADRNHHESIQPQSSTGVS